MFGPLIINRLCQNRADAINSVNLLMTPLLHDEVKVSAQLLVVFVGVRPMTIESNPDGSAKRVFVQMAAFDGFAVLDFKTHEEVERIPLPNLHTGVDMDPGREDAPSHGIGVSPDKKTLWVTSIPQNAVFVYDLTSPELKLTDTIKLPDLQIPGTRLGGAVANWVTFTPDNQIFIANSGLRSVTAIGVDSHKINAVVPVGEVPKRINTLVLK